MARGRKPRTWVKMDCEGLLHGSINHLFIDDTASDVDTAQITSLACQAVWMKMIALSETCGGRPGYIEDNNEKGLPTKYIAYQLQCPQRLLDSVLETMIGDGAIKKNGTGSIQLVNFDHYQFSEYDRQKPYRDAKKSELESKEDPDRFIKGKYGHMVQR